MREKERVFERDNSRLIILEVIIILLYVLLNPMQLDKRSFWITYTIGMVAYFLQDVLRIFFERHMEYKITKEDEVFIFQMKNNEKYAVKKGFTFEVKGKRIFIRNEEVSFPISYSKQLFHFLKRIDHKDFRQERFKEHEDCKIASVFLAIAVICTCIEIYIYPKTMFLFFFVVIGIYFFMEQFSYTIVEEDNHVIIKKDKDVQVKLYKDFQIRQVPEILLKDRIPTVLKVITRILNNKMMLDDGDTRIFLTYDIALLKFLKEIQQ